MVLVVIFVEIICRAEGKNANTMLNLASFVLEYMKIVDFWSKIELVVYYKYLIVKL